MLSIKQFKDLVDRAVSSKFVTIALWIIVLFYLAVIINYQVIRVRSEDRILEIKDIERKYEYGLVLGTTPEIRGKVYPFFWNRIDAAVSLYESGKISGVIVSGRVGSKKYNEPMSMKNALMKRGIPENRIICDNFGDRTLFSIYRAKHVFGLNSFLIISQKFHNERALAIARHFELDCKAFSAENDSFIPLARVIIREHFARVRMLFDFVIKTKVPEKN